jgi:hypothetical protein
MKNFAGWKKTQKTQFQQMTKAQAGEVWRKTRWNWAQCDKIHDQEIANLIFDWGVRRWNSLIKGIAAVLNKNVTDITRKVKMIDVGGNPASKTDGFLILNDVAINLINSNPNPQLLHSLLKAKRQSLDKPAIQSIKARYQSFSYTGTQTKDVLLANRNLKIQDRTRNTEGGYNFAVIDIAYGLAITKLLRIW